MIAAVLALALGIPPPAVTPCVEGTVSTADGRPLRGAVVTLLPRDGDAPLQTRTRGDGFFSLGGLVRGAYWLVAEHEGFEPSLAPLDVGASSVGQLNLVHLTPLMAFLAQPQARAELPWLLRGVGVDPTRLAEGDPPRTGFFPVKGRVLWNAVAGGATSTGTYGSRTEVELGGELTRGASWFIDGQSEALAQHSAAAGRGWDSESVLYGVDLSRSRHLLRVFGEIRRDSHGLGPTPVSENRAHYALDYQHAGDDSNLDVQLSYRSSMLDGLNDAMGVGDPSGHAMWEGRGRLTQRLGDRHTLTANLRASAQRWSQASRGLLLDSLPTTGMLQDSRSLQPRRWALMVNGAHSWRLGGLFTLESGIDVGRVAEQLGPPFLRSRVGLVVLLAGSGTIRAEASRILLEPREADEALGERSFRPWSARIAMEQQLDGVGELRLAYVHNGFFSFDDTASPLQPGQDYLLFARDSVTSDELRVDIVGARIGRVRTRASGSFGTAQGTLAVLPVRILPMSLVATQDRSNVLYASALIGASLEPTETDVSVRYRWLDDVNGPGGDWAWLDVEVAQGLPWWEPLGSRLELLLAVRGNLGHAEPADAYGWAPGSLVEAGLGVRF